MADYSELNRKAQEIRNEVKAGANTANRVGVALEGIVNALEEENLRATGKENNLGNDIQRLQDETEDLQSMRDVIDSLGTDKADKSALEATNKEVSKKQNQLVNYKENPSNGSVEIFSQDIVSMRNDSQGGVASVEVYNEENAGGIIPVAKMSAEKENGDYAYVETRGNEVNIVGDYVNVNGADLGQTIQGVATLNMRVHELGNFATAKDAEDKAREPLYSGNEGISIIHYTVNGSTDGLILQHQDVDSVYHRSVQTLFYHARQYVRFVWFTDSTRTVLLENANFTGDWWETSISHLEYDKTTHTIKCRRIEQDVNSTKWITLPSASTSTDGLMTMEQVKSLEGKQDALQTYEETTDKAEVKMPNGNSYVRVTKNSAGMYAQDGKSGIVNSSSGSRLVYMETATDSSGDSYTSHRDDISIGKHDGNSATHITMTSKSTTEEAGEKITNTSTIQVNPDGISMSSPEGVIGDVVKEISDKASAEAVNELRQEVEDKAPKVGYAPDLKVSYAKELVGRGEATPEVIGSIRPTGEISIGDGNATIEKIKGKTVVWNQIIRLTNSNAQYDTELYNITLLGGTIAVTKSEGGTLSKDNIYAFFTHNFIALRKYLLIYNLRRSDEQNTAHSFDGSGIYDGTKYHDLIQTKGTDYKFFSPTESFTSKSMQIGQIATKGVALSYTLKPVIYDLTQMFGVGNEPTTIEEFEARKPLNVTNEYNEGTLVSYQGGEIKSVGFNAWDEEWENGAYSVVTGNNTVNNSQIRSANYLPVIPNCLYKTEVKSKVSALWWLFFDANKDLITGVSVEGIINSYNGFDITNKEFKTPSSAYYAKFYATADYGSTYKNDICLHLVHSGYRNGQYEPYIDDVHSLPDIKSIKDSNGNVLFPYGLLSAGSVHDEITATKAVKRVGVVDMGTLDWGNFKHGFTTYSIRPASGSGKGKNLICAKYPTYTPEEIYNNDAIVGIAGPQSGYWGGLFLADSKYSTGAELKAAMSGVLLYYELAEPIEVDLPEPLNMTYEAWDFGTEELLAEGATTPLNADIVYQFNAVDRIRENSSAIDDLEEHVEEHKDDGIELLTNGNLKLTLKGETREFMPATPSGDPMHWAYVSAGAEYNDSGEDIVKDAPWAALADTDEEKKVTHKARCWYLNGVGDMTNDDIRYSYINRTLLYDLNRRASFSSDTALRTIYPVHRGSSVSGLGPTKASTLFQCTKLETCLLSKMQNIRQERDYSLSLSSSYEFYKCTALKAIGQVTPTTTDINKFAHCTSLRYIWIYALQVSINLKDSSLISKLSVKYMIENAAPTSAITITLHHDAYERMKGDADILQALTTKNSDLATKGNGKVSLVCATDNDTIPTE